MTSYEFFLTDSLEKVLPDRRPEAADPGAPRLLKNQRWAFQLAYSCKNDDFGETSTLFSLRCTAPPRRPWTFSGWSWCPVTIPATAPGTRTTSPPGPACCRTCCARRAGRNPSRRCLPSGAACGSRWTRRALPPARRTCGWRCWARRARSWRSLPSGWRCWTRPCRPRPCCRPSGSTPTAWRTTTMCRCSARSTGASWTISWPAPPTTASTCCSRRCSPRRWTPAKGGRAHHRAAGGRGP